jgi:hypothetical protein
MDAVVAMLLADNDTFENYIKPEVDKYDASEIMKLDTVDPLDLPEEIKNLLPVTSANDKRKARKPGLD